MTLYTESGIKQLPGYRCPDKTVTLIVTLDSTDMSLDVSTEEHAYKEHVTITC